MKDEFSYYKEIDLCSDNTADNRMNGPEVGGNDQGKSTFSENDQMTLKDEKKITEEGVYYTSFLFEVMNKQKLQNDILLADQNNDISQTDQNLKYLTLEKSSSVVLSAGAADNNQPNALGPAPDVLPNGTSISGGGMRRNLRSHWEYKKYGTPNLDRKFLHDKY